MSLAPYFDVCGGIENITRTLLTEKDLMIEVRDKHLVQDSELIKARDQIQGETQLTFSRPESLTTEMLLKVGEDIAAQQSKRFSVLQQPVECEYRPSWHISPPQGLLNDPNGFIYHDGAYHLFYQWFPYGCEHKDKHWVHLTSQDLVEWEWQSVALTPSLWCDSHGVFSGHALSQGKELMLFYTGNTRIGQERDRQTTQCLATSSDGLNFTKHGPVIDALPLNVTPHIRDPKVVRHNDKWLMLLGAQTTELKGRLAIYQSEDLYQWAFVGLFGEEMGDFGYMWECPDLFTLNEQLFVVIGPQGIPSFSEHNTIPHHNGIVKAQWVDGDGLRMGDFQHLDYGFDFYAPQSMQTPDGRRVMCAWMGLPDEVNQPSTDNGWVHQLTAMRELSYRDGALYQWPILEMESLIEPSSEIKLDANGVDVGTKSFDLTVTLDWGDELNLFENSVQKFVLRADEENRRLIMDRSQTLNRAQDTIRELPLASERIELRILADNSSLEVFVNGGAAVMTSRVFTDKDATKISIQGVEKTATFRRYKPMKAPFSQS
ncbi:glycoside hydrolase family 32 protein [Vibrio natriegens]|uniref:glycoside hydrolase family 32 protein n=1 Tax=Vibrio natriegens TaxID=691 RepID=UPI00228474D3|nr:glycoside hydrolase family 32 protein [Vibrio natriegens]MCY9877290.1 glycoside hydrolase family 32 protein [Vibrio natriegens]